VYALRSVDEVGALLAESGFGEIHSDERTLGRSRLAFTRLAAPGQREVGVARLLLRILVASLAIVASVRSASAGPFLWQTSSEGDDIHVFDLQSRQLVRRLVVGPEPHGIAAPADARVVYVTLEANDRPRGELLWIDPRAYCIRHRMEICREPHAIATTPDGRWIYALSFSSVKTIGRSGLTRPRIAPFLILTNVASSVEEGCLHFPPYHRRGHFQFGCFTTPGNVPQG
jgi:hypothetical protein